MSRRRIVVALAVTAAVAGSAVPALADSGDGTRVCLVATHDRNNPGPAPLCVWAPVLSAK